MLTRHINIRSASTSVLAVEGSQPTPTLSLGEWQVQMARLSNGRSVADDPIKKIINRRATIAEAALSLLSGQAGDAADLAKLARTSNPDLSFVRWYEIGALVEKGELDAALTSLQDFARTLAEESPASLEYAKVVRPGETEGGRTINHLVRRQDTTMDDNLDRGGIIYVMLPEVEQVG